MKKYITYILFFILVIGGSGSVKANPLDKAFNKGKELVSNVKLSKKSIEPFLETNNIFIKFNDKTLEYSFQNNGVVTIYDKFNIIDNASWKFAGFLQNAVKITYKNDEITYFQFYKGFEKISRVKNLSKRNDDQTDFTIEHLTKKNANDQRIAEKKRIEDEKIAKAKAKKLEEERKLALKQKEKKQENLKDKKQEYLKFKSEFNDQCKERFFGTSGYKEDSAEYIECIYREADKKKEQDKLIAEQIKSREENKKKLLSKKPLKKETIPTSKKSKLPLNTDLNKQEPIVLLYDGNAVNNDMIADLNIPSFIKNKKITSINDEEIDELKNKYTQVSIIIKKDYLVNSVKSGTESYPSQYISGTISKPNPEYRKITLDINQLRALQVDYQNRVYMLQQKPKRNCGPKGGEYQSMGEYFSCIGYNAEIDNGIRNYNNAINDIHNKISYLTTQLSQTDSTLFEDVYKPYNIKLNLIDAKKTAQYEFFLIKDDEVYFSDITVDDNKIFKIPSKISNQDRDQNILNKFDTLEDVKQWEASDMKNASYQKLLKDFNENKKTTTIKNLYASLNVEQTGFLAKLFAPKKEDKQIKFKRVQDQNIDKRFYNIVIVETLEGMGSGFYIKPNQIITNYHVVEGAGRVTVVDYFGKSSSAKVIKTDIRRDLALLETNLKGTPVKFYRSTINPGMKVDAIGHPRGFEYSLASGVVSSVRMYASTYNVTSNPNTKFIQTDVAINPGNSGGPLFHNQWVVGVNTQGFKKAQTDEGLNFAVHLDELLDFINQ